MSRNLAHKSIHTEYITGSDHAVGRFIQITDKRFADSKEDLQGEGYVLDWDELFGFSTNLINATLEDIKKGPEVLQPKVEAFIEKLKNHKL